MAKIDELKRLVAETLKISPLDIDDDFSLKTGRLKTSAGSVILSNIVRKVYGIKIDCKKVSTFGELKSLTGDGQDSVLAQPTIAEVEEDIHFEESGKEQEMCLYPGAHLVCGIDIQEIDIFPESDDYWTDSFYTDNFTKDEIAYSVTAHSPKHSFAGRWCVKEALHKCGGKYYDIPLRDIQVVKQKDGSVFVEVRTDTDDWKKLPFSCSLSHAENYAVGMVTGFEV